MRRIDPNRFHVATRGTSRRINRQIALTLIGSHQPISRADLARRMKAMRKQVMEHDVGAWADSFLAELSAIRPSHGKSVRPARRS